jgi:hypothetical protein
METRIKFQPGNPGRLPLETLRTFGSRYAVPAILAALTFWLASSGFSTIQKIVDYYTPLPMWDYWRVVDHLADYESLHWGVLWQQHNEHRIVFPELVFALDMLLLHGRMVLPLVLSVLCYIGTWLVLAWTLFAETSVPLATRLVAVLIAGIVACFESAAGVLAIPFLLQWTLMQLASAIALVSASKLRSGPPARHLGLTVAACTVASYSSGNGLLLWPVVIVLAKFVGARKRDVLLLCAAAVLAIGFYFIGYRLAGELKLGTALSSPVYLLKYVASYLSMPFGGMRTPSFGIKLGLWLCATVLVSVLIAARTRRLAAHAVCVPLGYFCFTVATAILTAGGRMDTRDPTFTAAHAFRYLSVPQMNWAASILLLFAVISPLQKARVYVPLTAAAIAVLLSIAFPKLSPWLGGVTSYLTEQQVATLAIESGLHDIHLIETMLYPDPAFIEAMLNRLKSGRLSIYYRGRTRYLGRSLDSVASIRPNERVPGEIVDVTLLASGFELRGWADRSGRKLPAASLLFTDESGKIVGFGRQFAAGFPRELTSPDIPPSLGWVGFISNGRQPALVSTWVEAPGSKVVYPLGHAVPVGR